MRITIVVPAYQAAKTLRSVLDRIPKDIMEEIHKIIIANDASTDSTAQIAAEAVKTYPKIELVNHPQNMGYAQIQKTSFKQALQEQADAIVLLHSDGQYAPELLGKMIEPIKNGQADVTQGSRILGGKALEGGMPLYKYIANRALSTLENIALGLNFTEYHSGYMAYTRKALETIPFEKLSDTFHFDGEMLFMACKRNLRVLQVPIPTHYGSEKSHLKPISYGFDVLKIIAKYKLGKYDF
ncbi:glycosyltransferase family 2 protein [Elusimicrobiota bacterium]